jgi:hypothetical protein
MMRPYIKLSYTIVQIDIILWQLLDSWYFIDLKQ